MTASTRLRAVSRLGWCLFAAATLCTGLARAHDGALPPLSGSPTPRESMHVSWPAPTYTNGGYRIRSALIERETHSSDAVELTLTGANGDVLARSVSGPWSARRAEVVFVDPVLVADVASVSIAPVD